MDPDKIPDGPYSKDIFAGIEVSSRYGKNAELRHMTAALAKLPLHLMRQVKSIWCDSKAFDCYSVVLDPQNFDGCIEIGKILDRAFMEICGGHNGISFYAGGELFDGDNTLFIYEKCPNWEGDLT
jgi:hypothetical protein